MTVRHSVLPLLWVGFSIIPSFMGVGAVPVQAQQFPRPVIRQLPRPIVKQGYGIKFNQRTYYAHWVQWTSSSGQPVFGITDSGLDEQFGFELLSTNNPQQQPVQWFSDTTLKAQVHPFGRYRFLEITPYAERLGWQMQVQGKELLISAPTGRVGDVRVGNQDWGKRIVVDLDRPVPWRLSKLTYSRNGYKSQQFSFTIDATVAPGAVRRWGGSALGSNTLKSLAVTTQNGQTIVKGTIHGRMRLNLWSVANPSRLIIDVRPNGLRPRKISWAPGVVWQDQIVTLGSRQFPVTSVAIDPKHPKTQLKPIWGNASLVGTVPLSTIVQRSQATAAINGGYFSRATKTPLGALRREGLWASNPILWRGAVGWTPQGQVLMDRLMLRESLTTSEGKRFRVASRDSGFTEGGVAVYTRFWGSSYWPLTRGETLVTVQNDRVTGIRAGGGTTVPIPKDGYLIALRSQIPPTDFPIGTKIQLQAITNPKQFNPFPNILAGGPLLIKNGQAVLNTGAERFKAPFGTQAAPRSGIAQLADGTIMLAVAHKRINGPSPTLSEWTAIFEKLGAVNALNLDGGSSTSLYLGGQYLDRHASTAARVHNGVGLFVNPKR